MASSANLPPSPTFPNLKPDNHIITSPATSRYNCIAWAAEDELRWWWPDSDGEYFWPVGAPRVETVDAFAAAFETLGYEECVDASFEVGHTKIALYALAGKPTHAARQRSDGRWSSKLGRSVDIAHALEALDGPVYGQAVLYMHRRESPVSDIASLGTVIGVGR